MRREEARSLVLRQLRRQVDIVPNEICDRIGDLSLEQLENLGEALLDFSTLADLETWLEQMF